MQMQLPSAAGTNGMDASSFYKRMAPAGADTQKKRMKHIIQETERRVGPDIDMLKELQRTDPIGKEQWWAFCDCHGDGVRDPGKHPADFVQDFLSKYSAGMRFTSPRVNMMPALVKEGERRSNFFKEAWVSYCGTFGSGLKDPAKHDEQFLVGFMDFLGQRGWMALSAARTGRMPLSAMPQVPQQSTPLVARGDQSHQQYGLNVASYGSPVGAALGTSLAEQLLGPARLHATSQLLGAAMAAPTSGASASSAAPGTLYGAAPGALTAAGLPGAVGTAAYGTMPGVVGGDVSSAYNLAGTYGAAALGSAVGSTYSSLAGTSPALGAGAAYGGYAGTPGAVADPTAAAYAAALGQHYAAAAASQHVAAGGASGYDALGSQLAAALQAYAAGYSTVAGAAAPQAYGAPGAVAAAATPQAYAMPGTSVGAAAPQAYTSPGAAPGVTVASQAYALPPAPTAAPDLAALSQQHAVAAPPQQYALPAAPAATHLAAPQAYTTFAAAGAAEAPAADAAQGAASGSEGAPQAYATQGVAPGQPEALQQVAHTNVVAAATAGAGEVSAAP